MISRILKSVQKRLIPIRGWIRFSSTPLSGKSIDCPKMINPLTGMETLEKVEFDSNVRELRLTAALALLTPSGPEALNTLSGIKMLRREALGTSIKGWHTQ